MKKTKLPNGYIRLTPAKNKCLYYLPSNKYFSEAETKPEGVKDFIEVKK